MPKLRRRTKALISTQRDDPITNKVTISAIVSDLFPIWKQSIEHAAEMDDWYYDKINTRDLPRLPRKATRDIRDLRDSSPTGWAKMIADSMTQDLIIEELRQRDNGNPAPAQRLWQQNGLDARQKPVHDGVIRHGKAFNLVAPAIGRLDGLPTAYIRGKSALNSDAFYRDDFDEFPDYFLEGHLQRDDDGTRRWRLDFWDEKDHHWLSCEEDGSKMTYIAYEPHGMGICPAVRAAGNIDLTGRVIGEIEPYIRIFKRINQSTMDRLAVQRFGAFVIRYIAGIEKPASEEDRKAAALALSVTDLLMVEDPHAKIGSLPATQLDGYIRSREADIRDLSAVSQTASFHMLGLSDNVGADGLAAAEASHMRKMEIWKIGLGEFWETSMRLAGHAAKKPEIAEDFQSRAHWRDTSTQSFQSLMQGLGVAVTQLGLPPESVWDRIPNWQQSDTNFAKKLLEEARTQALADAELELDRQKELATSGRPAAPQR